MATRKGRPPSPVANAVNGLGKLAEYLRAARCKRELSREQLAIKLGCSITTIQRAEGGKTPPARDTLDGYIRVCVLDHTQAEALWSKAVNLCRGRTPRTYTQAPRPDLVRTADELGAALARVWEQDGRPSTREMERRAEGRYKETRAPLSRSTAERISRRKSLPGSERTLHAYLIACEVPEAKFPMWAQAWGRVQGRRQAVRDRVRREARRVIQKQAPEATSRMRDAGLIPLDKFRGPVAPWSARHITCDTVSRFRLRSVLEGTAHCPVCDELLPPVMSQGH
ncbi:helix-turn-helix transcriptional regulator [Streptomyces sp. NPDC049602]|uniref:helix-turn-helix domain-containing protein n=1 Tax=Streptomyces sp. NPDC049602 TaxID=3155504 RepID=UPI003413C1FB